MSGLPQFLLRKNRTRTALSILYPEFRQDEYRLPPWMLVPNWQTQAVHVFKVQQYLEQHLPWLLANRPQTKVIFLMRHPLGFAQSLYRRLYQHGNQRYYHQQNCRLLQARLQQSEQLGVHFPDVDLDGLSLLESVIWNWWVFHEMSYQLFSPHPAVLTVVYEQILANPTVQLKSVFEHCALPWDRRTEQAVQQTYSRSAHLAQSFRTYWSQQDQQTAYDILCNASVRSFWPDESWDQLCDLAADQQATQVAYSPY